MIHYIPNALLSPNIPITFVVIGSGGTGSKFLRHLATISNALRQLDHCGIHVELYDDARVTQANTARQEFFPSDVGQYKANVTISRINRAYGFNWIAHNKLWIGEKANFIVTCCDVIEPRIKANSIIKHSNPNTEDIDPRDNYYWLDMGNMKTKGQTFLASYCGQLESILDRHPDYGSHSKPNEPSCSAFESLMHQDLFINEDMALIGAKMTWNLLRDGRTEINAIYNNQFKTAQLKLN